MENNIFIDSISNNITFLKFIDEIGNNNFINYFSIDKKSVNTVYPTRSHRYLGHLAA
jgi:hypothetical protein